MTGDGAKFVVAVLQQGAPEALRRTSRALFVDEEVAAFDFVRRHFRQFGELPTIETVESDLNVRLPDAQETIAYYDKKIKDRYFYGLIQPHFTEFRTALTQNDMDAARERVLQMAALARQTNQEEDIRDLRQATQMVVQAYEDARFSPIVTGVPTGWGRFDAITGGYQPGDLVTFVGRMAMGKTYLLLRQAEEAWLSGYRVLFISMEMPIIAIGRRLVAMRAHINPEGIRKGALPTDLMPVFEEATRGFAEMRNFFIYAGGFSKTTEQVEGLIQEYQPDITFIDGAYLLKTEGSSRATRTERIANSQDAIKTMTITTNRPIVQTMQFGRGAGAKGERGSMENIGMTDVTGMHSSLAIAIKEGKPPYQQTRRVMEFMKGREGEHGIIDISFVFNSMNFTELEFTAGDAVTAPVDLERLV